MKRLLMFISLWSMAGLCPARQAVAQAEVYTREVVLFVSPDSIQLRRLEKELGDDFFTAADDENWYRSEAYQVLDSLRVEYKFMDRGPTHFLVGGEVREYNWESIEAAWFVVLYDGEREPKVVTSIDLPFEIDYLR